jgi:2-methylcitrate dehydratase PrpD
MGRVTVRTKDGRTLEQRIASPKGDPDNTLTRAELDEKAVRLAEHGGGATAQEMKNLIARIWRLHEEANVRDFVSSDDPDSI